MHVLPTSFGGKRNRRPPERSSGTLPKRACEGNRLFRPISVVISNETAASPASPGLRRDLLTIVDAQGNATPAEISSVPLTEGHTGVGAFGLATVHNHITNIFRDDDAHSRLEAVAIARRDG